VDVVLIRAEQGVRVGADAVERDEAEVEQPAPPDDDVEPQCEQHEDDRVERDAPDVPALESDREQAEDPDEERQPRPPRDDGEARLERPQHAAAADTAFAVPGDPLVAPDRGARRTLGRTRLGSAPERCRERIVPVGRV
jgi:hypothetical protein